MLSLKSLILTLPLVLVCAAGCGPQPVATTSNGKKAEAKPEGHKTPDDDDEDHPHGDGPNGGPIFDLGKHHAEFSVSRDKKECYLLFIRGDDKDAKPLLVACKELTLTTKEAKVKEGPDTGKVVPPISVTLTPAAGEEKDGKAARFVGTHPGFATAADFAGTVAGEVGGKPSSGKFKR